MKLYINIKNNIKKKNKQAKFMRIVIKYKKQYEHFCTYFFNSYFSAIFLLILSKLFLNLILIQVSLKINICLLLILFIFSFKIDLYKKFKLILMQFISFVVPYHVYSAVDGLDPDTVKELNKQINQRCFLIYLIVRLLRIRLFIETHKVSYIILNFIIVQYFLLNFTFWGITYFYFILIIVSRMLFFMIEANFTEMKTNISQYQPEILNSKKRIKNTQQNGILLMFWCLRNLDMIAEYEKSNLEYVQDYNYQILKQKYIEQEVMKIKHNIKQPYFELTDKNVYIKSQIY